MGHLLDGIYPLFGVDAVYCITGGHSLIVVVVLIGVMVQMVREEVSWLSELHEF